MSITDELFTEIYTWDETPKALSEEESVQGTPPEVQQWQPSPQYPPIVNTMEYGNAVVPSKTGPRVTSTLALPYAQSETQTVNVSDQSRASMIHPPDPLPLGTATSASHLAKCTMSPERDIVLRHKYIDLIWELHQLEAAGALSETEYHLRKDIILGQMTAL